jgi:hypothetical protein
MNILTYIKEIYLSKINRIYPPISSRYTHLHQCDIPTCISVIHVPISDRQTCSIFLLSFFGISFNVVPTGSEKIE